MALHIFRFILFCFPVRVLVTPERYGPWVSSPEFLIHVYAKNDGRFYWAEDQKEVSTYIFLRKCKTLHLLRMILGFWINQLKPKRKSLQNDLYSVW